MESFLHPCPCQHPSQDLEPSHMAGPLCQCSATLCAATKPQGDPLAQCCAWTSHHLRQHQGPAAPLCLCSLPAGQWAPYLARLGNTGSINAWSTDRSNAWIQVRGASCLRHHCGHCKAMVMQKDSGMGSASPAIHTYSCCFLFPLRGEH